MTTLVVVRCSSKSTSHQGLSWWYPAAHRGGTFGLAVELNNFSKIIGGHKSFLGCHCCLCFVFLAMSALGFKARLDPSFTIFVACSILRFTSGVAPANLLTTSIAPKHSFTYLRFLALVGLKPMPRGVAQCAAGKSKPIRLDFTYSISKQCFLL